MVGAVSMLKGLTKVSPKSKRVLASLAIMKELPAPLRAAVTSPSEKYTVKHSVEGCASKSISASTTFITVVVGGHLYVVLNNHQ